MYRDFPSSCRMEPSQEHEAKSVRSGQQQGGKQRVRTEGTNLLLFKPSQVPPVVEAHLFSLPVLHKGGSWNNSLTCNTNYHITSLLLLFIQQSGLAGKHWCARSQMFYPGELKKGQSLHPQLHVGRCLQFLRGLRKPGSQTYLNICMRDL